LLKCDSEFKQKACVTATLQQVGYALGGTGTALWMCHTR